MFKALHSWRRGGIRRRLTRTMVGAQPVPDRELPVHSEIDNADANGGAEIVEVQMKGIDVEVVQMDQVLMDDVDVVPSQVELVVLNNNEEMQLVIDFLLQGFNEEFEPISLSVPVNSPEGDRLASVQHPLPEQYYIVTLNAVCRDCGASYFPI